MLRHNNFQKVGWGSQATTQFLTWKKRPDIIKLNAAYLFHVFSQCFICLHCPCATETKGVEAPHWPQQTRPSCMQGRNCSHIQYKNQYQQSQTPASFLPARMCNGHPNCKKLWQWWPQRNRYLWIHPINELWKNTVFSHNHTWICCKMKVNSRIIL